MNSTKFDPNDPKTWPSEDVQKITDAPDPLRNCTECGMWLQQGETHAHENNNS